MASWRITLITFCGHGILENDTYLLYNLWPWHLENNLLRSNGHGHHVSMAMVSWKITPITLYGHAILENNTYYYIIMAMVSWRITLITI